VTVEAVVQVLQQNVANAQAVITALVSLLPETRSCTCGTALQHAIMTAPGLVPAETRERLALIIGKYLD
jgi:5'-methylthioadenosine phosphorylase